MRLHCLPAILSRSAAILLSYILIRVMASFQEKWLEVDDIITERGIYMFNNELLSDVSLVAPVSRQEGEPTAKKTKMAIPAHKFVLSMCSPVFFAMFCGELAEKSDSVDLPDCEYEGVLEMLRHMYGGEAKLNENNVMQVLYVAKKYMVKSLAKLCIEFLRSDLNPENVFCVLSHAERYDENVLVDQCWEVIDRETEEALKSEGFMNIEKSLLEEIVKRDTLTVREEKLFTAVDLWATKECERQGMTADGNVKRRILGETILEQIRFPVMEEKEFANVVLDSEILTQQELVKLMKHFNSVLTSPVGFHGNKRVGTLQSCFRFPNPCFAYAVRPFDGKQCIDFRVNKDIVLHGIRLFGRENGAYEVNLVIKNGGVPIVFKSGKFSSVLMHRKEGDYQGFEVMFNPVNLTKECFYTVKVRMDGPDAYYGSMGAVEVTSHGVTFFFRNRSDSCGTTVRGGQFADFLFKLPE